MAVKHHVPLGSDLMTRFVVEQEAFFGLNGERISPMNRQEAPITHIPAVGPENMTGWVAANMDGRRNLESSVSGSRAAVRRHFHFAANPEPR